MSRQSTVSLEMNVSSARTPSRSSLRENPSANDGLVLLRQHWRALLRPEWMAGSNSASSVTFDARASTVKRSILPKVICVSIVDLHVAFDESVLSGTDMSHIDFTVALYAFGVLEQEEGHQAFFRLITSGTTAASPCSASPSVHPCARRTSAVLSD